MDYTENPRFDYLGRETGSSGFEIRVGDRVRTQYDGLGRVVSIGDPIGNDRPGLSMVMVEPIGPAYFTTPRGFYLKNLRPADPSDLFGAHPHMKKGCGCGEPWPADRGGVWLPWPASWVRVADGTIGTDQIRPPVVAR